MRQIMPHRNNIGPRDLKCKTFLVQRTEFDSCATFLPQRRNPRSDMGMKFLMLNNGLYMLQMFIGYASPTKKHG